MSNQVRSFERCPTYRIKAWAMEISEVKTGEWHFSWWHCWACRGWHVRPNTPPDGAETGVTSGNRVRLPAGNANNKGTS